MAEPTPGGGESKVSMLNAEQEAVLDLYLTYLDTFLEDLQEAEKLQVKIETLHLRRILGQ